MKKTIKWIILVLLAAAAVGVLAWVITSSVSTSENPVEPDTPVVPDESVVDEQFIVYYGSEVSYTSDSVGTLTLPAEGNVLFQVVGTDEYTVKVVANIEDDPNASEIPYYYLWGGRIGRFYDDDYTEQFIKNLSAPNFFYIDCSSGNYELEALLESYTGSEITSLCVPDDLEYPYQIIVTSAEGEVITILVNQEGVNENIS